MRSRTGLLLASTALVAGCASTPAPRQFTISDAAAYEAAFAAAKETLVHSGFDLDRVDARAGVITTLPHRTAGLATPWDRDQSSLSQEWEDFVNLHQRTVRVTFEPAPAAIDDALPPDPVAGIDPSTGSLRFRVSAVVERVRIPGWRVEADAVALSTYATDPSLAARGMSPRHIVPLERDTALEDRLAAEIARRAAAAGPG